jgi:replicative DNA helicase
MDSEIVRLDYLSDLMDEAVPIVGEYERDLLVSAFNRKAFIQKAKEIGGLVSEVENLDDLSSLYERAEAIISSGGDEDVSDDPKIAVAEAVEWLQELWEGGIKPLKTEIEGLDSLLQIIGGKIVLLAARPSVGKTALALQIARAICDPREKGTDPQKVNIFSLEMPRRELVLRYTSQMTGITGNRIIEKLLDANDMSRIIEAVQKIPYWPFTIDDSEEIDIDSLCYRIKKSHREGGKIAIIDYFELIDPPEYLLGAPRETQLSYISKKLRSLAKKLDMPIVLLSQMNREIEKRKEKIPQMSDLRGSGSLEQDAHAIMFLHRDEDDSGNLGKYGTIYLRKNRGGQPGTVDIEFDGVRQQFTEA